MQNITDKGNGLFIDQLQISNQGKPLIQCQFLAKRGEILTIMGRSGVGKSTLLNWITGMLDDSFSASGELWLNQQVITDKPAHLRGIGVLYQDSLLFPHLSVANNIAFGMPKQPAKQRQKIIAEALAKVGLQGYDDRHPQSLSGGQQVRVALLRMLLSEPKAVLLDEPFSKLDSALRQEVRRTVFDLVREKNIPAIMVTHDIADAEAANGPIIELTHNGFKVINH